MCCQAKLSRLLKTLMEDDLTTDLFFIIIYSSRVQVNGLFLMQGIHMKLPQFSQSKGGGGIPAAWFQLFNVVTVLVMVPLVDKFVYPRLDKLFERAPHLCRMALGKNEKLVLYFLFDKIGFSI